MSEQLPTLLKEAPTLPESQPVKQPSPTELPRKGGVVRVDLPSAPRAPREVVLDRAMEWVAALARVLGRDQGFHLPEPDIRADIDQKLKDVLSLREYLKERGEHVRALELHARTAQAELNAANEHIARLERNLAEVRLELRTAQETRHGKHTARTQSTLHHAGTGVLDAEPLDPILDSLRQRRTGAGQNAQPAGGAASGDGVLAELDPWAGLGT